MAQRPDLLANIKGAPTPDVFPAPDPSDRVGRSNRAPRWSSGRPSRVWTRGWETCNDNVIVRGRKENTEGGLVTRGKVSTRPPAMFLTANQSVGRWSRAGFVPRQWKSLPIVSTIQRGTFEVAVIATDRSTPVSVHRRNREREKESEGKEGNGKLQHSWAATFHSYPRPPNFSSSSPIYLPLPRRDNGTVVPREYQRIGVAVLLRQPAM